MRGALAFVATLLLSACAASSSLPVDRYYRIDATALPSAAADPQSILLEPFEARGVYAERALLFHEAGSGSAMRQYGHQFWSEPPTLMLDDALMAALRAAFGEARVHGRASRERPDFQVRPRLRRLEQVIDGSRAFAAYAVEFTVTDREGRPRFVLAFDETEPATTAGPDTYVAALDALVARANAKLVERLAAEFQSATAR